MLSIYGQPYFYEDVYGIIQIELMLLQSREHSLERICDMWNLIKFSLDLPWKALPRNHTQSEVCSAFYELYELKCPT